VSSWHWTVSPASVVVAAITTEDDGVVGERLAAPVLTDPGKEAMFNLVPFARSRRQVAHGDRQAGLIGELLQFPFPQAHARAIASSPIGTDEQPLGLRILELADRVPPAANAFHCEGGRLVVNAHIDPAGILCQVVHSVGSGSTHTADGEVGDAHEA